MLTKFDFKDTFPDDEFLYYLGMSLLGEELSDYVKHYLQSEDEETASNTCKNECHDDDESLFAATLKLLLYDGTVFSDTLSDSISNHFYHVNRADGKLTKEEIEFVEIYVLTINASLISIGIETSINRPIIIQLGDD